MADEELVARLRAGVKEWNRWLMQSWVVLSRPPRKGLDLTGADLTGAQLANANLTIANLTGANLTGADLTDVDLTGANLTGANLTGANLTYADLTGAKLPSADLTEARLICADLTSARLTNARLVGADLTDADLTDADLTDADLTDADLSATNFNGANLLAATLERAILYFTSLGGVSLESVEALNKVEFHGPCYLDYHTLKRSKGNIPDSFLRGCGWDDDFIAYTRKHMLKADEFYSCFISYSHTDRIFARRLEARLQRQGVRCWRDEKSLKGGDRISTAVFEAIRTHEKVVLCCSRGSLSSNWVVREVSKAIEKELKEGRDLLIPLNLDGHLFKWDHHLGDEVRSRLALDFTGWEHDNAIFEREFKRVVEALRGDS